MCTGSTQIEMPKDTGALIEQSAYEGSVLLFRIYH